MGTNTYPDVRQAILSYRQKQPFRVDVVGSLVFTDAYNKLYRPRTVSLSPLFKSSHHKRDRDGRFFVLTFRLAHHI
jgi:hypothetical protein